MAARARAVVWSQSALAALDEVGEYIAQDSRARAVRVLERVLAVAANLGTLSDRGRVVPEIGDSSIRELPVFRYRLMYRVEAERVVIVAFIHGARDFAAWRQEQADK
jgi:toxin ParE1/3/4